ncbi:SDR family oxidoreductase [Roseomonas sp. NAR14]|uniref:SDR family oxidoreductase n=1 Tax=Roseomonas acroporae TaxID=2937791 RepID=A0A9X1Y853_9PROT|nr:SDR family oxidoreductase [Roseomonas acroporae]MCK8784958.1 SDR family oxidoreductase [Roseomonas acroporae]
MPKTPDYFVGKSVAITGAGGGIGRATALIFAREGANVVCADIDGDAARRTAQEIEQRGGQALATETDVTSRAAVEEMVRQGVARFGRLHFLFNNAGAAMRRCKFLEIDDDLLEKTFAVNLKGTFYGMQAVLPHMLERGGGTIVNVASMSHKRGGPGASVHYAAAKGAVLTMTLGVAREFADRNIRCLSVSPGPVNTEFARASDTPPELVQKFIADVPMKRLAEPEEIGELVLFLCSDAAPYMTADTVYINGGGWR